MPPAPQILALDFDGVVCDGLIEYFQTAWKAYCQLFQPAAQSPPEGLAETFYRLRPVIETGWEMPVLLHGLQSGLSPAEISQDWPPLAQQLLTATGLTPQAAAAAVDGIRDAWIEVDLESWLGQHRFYPGVIARLQQITAAGPTLMIVSTKEGRFIQQLLAQQGLQLSRDQILGKEVKQPKYETLRQLQTAQPNGASGASLWFVEDRLKALELVSQQPDLAGVTLFLADWGYNTEAEKAAAQSSSRIHRLSIAQFSQPFSAWT